MQIKVKDHRSKEIFTEKVYGQKILHFLYKKSLFSKFFLKIFSEYLIFSKIYGLLQKTRFSKKKITSFIQKYHIDTSEFVKKEFTSFNDFFTRRINREFVSQTNELIFPADGRYLVTENINNFEIKGQRFSLDDFLQDRALAKIYQEGSMVIIRLCPSDYHRFHFCVDSYVKDQKLINGYLYSVNPIATWKNIKIFSENKRVVTVLENEKIGRFLQVEIGATNVGSIKQTYTTDFNEKGSEKGYFDLGGSCIVVLFQKNRVCFDKDLLNTSRHMESRCLFGDFMGKIL